MGLGDSRLPPVPEGNPGVGAGFGQGGWAAPRSRHQPGRHPSRSEGRSRQRSCPPTGFTPGRGAGELVVGGGGYFASPPARGGGALPALAPGFLTSPEAETCELMTGMARRTKGDAAPGGPAKTQPWGWTGGKIWAKSKARGWGQEQTQLRVPGQDGGGSAVAPAVSVARCVPRHRGSGMQRAVFAVERARTACIGRR